MINKTEEEIPWWLGLLVLFVFLGVLAGLLKGCELVFFNTDKLIEDLKSENPSVRNEAAERFIGLWWFFHDREKIIREGVDPLIVVMNDNRNNSAKYGAVVALNHIAIELKRRGDKRALESLIIALKDPWDGVRMYAAEALGVLCDERAVEPLINALRDEDWVVRCEVVGALGEIGSDKGVSPLIRLLQDSNQYVRSQVAQSLGWIGDKRAIEPLIVVLKDETEVLYVREDAERALYRITGQHFGMDPIKWEQWWEKNRTIYDETHKGK